MTRNRTLRQGRLVLTAWPSAFLAALASVAPVVVAGQAQVEPGFEKGRFQELAGPIGRLLKLTWEGKALRLDRGHWEQAFKGKTGQQALTALERELTEHDGLDRDRAARLAQRLLSLPPAEMAFERLKAIVGYGSSSSSTGSSGRKQEFSGRGLAARMQLSGESFRVLLEEEEAPGRTLILRDDGLGDVQIVLADAKGRLLLAVNQSSEGQFRVAHIAGGEVFAEGAASFEDFHARHRRYVEKRLFPLLKHVGVVLPWTRYAPQVRRAVLDKIRRPLTPGQIELARKLIRQLNDDSFKKREEATKALSANFGRYRDLIEQAAKEPTLSPEAASRLGKIVAENSDRDQVDQFIAARKLTEDVGYLVYLMQEVEEGERAEVARALKDLTGQRLGPDPAAWRKWWSANRSADQASDKRK